MAVVTNKHFGGNLVLTNDKVHIGSSFRSMTDEVYFSNFRYPGGSVTENHTWENGGLDQIFGESMALDDPKHVLTIREALSFASEAGPGITMVIPTFQFFNSATDEFHEGYFKKYLNELEKAILEYPDVRINSFEIGNEYWSQVDPDDYGKIANKQIPLLDELGERLASRIAGWEKPEIGIQAGRNWRPEGVEDSAKIASEIDLESRGLVDVIYQHAYPNPARPDPVKDQELTLDTMREYEKTVGFKTDLKFSLSEFNIFPRSATGVEQGAVWIEEFSARIDMGMDEYFHWGLNYKWLSNKFYDPKFAPGESDQGEILAKATPMGQVYDLASSNLPGKSIISDASAIEGIGVPEEFDMAGFSDANQRIVFFYNGTEKPGTLDLRHLPEGSHVSTNHLIDADSPESPWYDESIPKAPVDGEVADARGDMKVLSGKAAPDEMTLGPGEMAVVTITAPDQDLIIEGAHNETDYRTDMVDDQIYGGTGDDILRGHVGDDLLSGGDGRDVITGGKGNDTVHGGSGDDIIFDGRGENVLDGGIGDDLFVIFGGREEDSSIIFTGDGADLVLTSSDQNLEIVDFGDHDRIGFDGAFANADHLKESLSVDGEDLVVSLPDAGHVRLIGQADRSEDLHHQVVDFESPRSDAAFAKRSIDEPLPVGEVMLDDLSYGQVVELYDNIGSVDGISNQTGEGSHYWLGLEKSIARTGAAPDEVLPYQDEDQTSAPPIPPSDDEEQTSAPPTSPSENDDDPYRDDLEDDDDYQDRESASGGACFVATAAFGDRRHPDVVALRNFRDRHLVKYALGRRFVRFYWVIGPKLAKRTHPSDPHALLARKALSLVARILRKLKLT